MVSYKLYYFPVRFRAEHIRMMFHYHGTKFEDVHVTDWPQRKHEFPLGQLPVLEVDGKKLGQTQAIARYVALKCDLGGKGEWEQARVDEILDFAQTVYNAFRLYFYLTFFAKPDGRDAAQRDFLAAAEKYLPILAKLLEQSPNGFFVPSGPTVADFMVVDYLYTTKVYAPEVMKKWPALEKYIDKVYNLPKLRKYIDSRPKTDF